MSCDPTAGKALTLAVGARPAASPSITALTAANSELAAAIHVAQRMLAAYGDTAGFDVGQWAQAHGALSESLRILLRALDAEPDTDVMQVNNVAQVTSRCPASHPEDMTPCDGPVVVTVLDSSNAGANGCEHHAARLLASLTRGRVYGLPDAPAGTAGRVLKAAYRTRPFCWYENAPRTRPEQLSREENERGEQP